jgi:uncharacterized protein
MTHATELTHPTLAAPGTNRKAATWLGLAISLFGMIAIRQAFRLLSVEHVPSVVFAREICMFVLAGILLWLIRRREGLPLRSVGLGTAPWWKSLLWGVVIAIACIVPAALLMSLTHYGHGPGSQSFAKMPLWLITLVVVRAGFAEELFYRGYAIERLQSLGFGRAISWAVPLVIFSLAHWTGGAANILLAFVLGGILTAFYQWRRDLVANMFGHFLVDFISNVVPVLFA